MTNNVNLFSTKHDYKEVAMALDHELVLIGHTLDSFDNPKAAINHLINFWVGYEQYILDRGADNV